MSDELLDIEIGVLILRYGKEEVLGAIARSKEQTPEQLRRQLATTAPKRSRKKERPQTELTDLVAAESRDRKDIAEPLQALALAFENRTFLPQLRDVQRFLDRIGMTHGRLRSRTAAAPLLIRALTKLTREELIHLAAQEQTSHGESDYSLLARAIMGQPPKLSESGDAENKSDKSS